MPIPSRSPSRAPAALLPSSALDRLRSASRDLGEAALTTVPTARYAAAHRGALHAAAAVLAARARPVADPRRRGPRSAWVLLAGVAPELGEWARFFAAGAGKRAAAEAGLTRVVSAREADDLLRDAAAFLALAETTLGLDPRPALLEPRPAVPASRPEPARPRSCPG